MPKTTVTLMVDTDDPDLQQVIAEILALPEWSAERVALMVDLMRTEANRLESEFARRSATPQPLAHTNGFAEDPPLDGGRHRIA